MYTQNNFQEDYHEAASIVYQAGIHEFEDFYPTLKLVDKYVKFLGKCRRNSYHNYTIELNLKYANLASHEEIINVIVHEILHMGENCMNHGRYWKAAAQKIYLYNGMKIQRLASIEGNEIVSQYVADRKQLKYSTPHTYYEMHCNGCNSKMHTYERKTKAVEKIMRLKENSGYFCRKCGSHDISVNPVIR